MAQADTIRQAWPTLWASSGTPAGVVSSPESTVSEPRALASSSGVARSSSARRLPAAEEKRFVRRVGGVRDQRCTSWRHCQSRRLRAGAAASSVNTAAPSSSASPGSRGSAGGIRQRRVALNSEGASERMATNKCTFPHDWWGLNPPVTKRKLCPYLTTRQSVPYDRKRRVQHISRRILYSYAHSAWEQASADSLVSTEGVQFGGFWCGVLGGEKSVCRYILVFAPSIRRLTGTPRFHRRTEREYSCANSSRSSLFRLPQPARPRRLSRPRMHSRA
jgi:hypothetical protein